METMTPEKALEMLNEIRLRFETSGKNHELAKDAYVFLKSYINEKQTVKT